MNKRAAIMYGLGDIFSTEVADGLTVSNDQVDISVTISTSIAGRGIRRH